MKRSRRSSSNTAILAMLVSSVLAGAAVAQQPDAGRLTGKVVDAQTGEALPGVNVIVESTTIGAATDLDGLYTIKRVPPGTYTLVASMIGYTRTRIENVVITAGGTEKLDLKMSVEAIEGEEVVVEAKALRNAEVALLKDRKNAAAVSDAISAENMSKSGVGDAAAAMRRVTGASVVDGKYVYVRGLGERYGSTHLNGAEVPSPDPDKKAVQMDLFPSNLLDNIVTVKTATPDKPGNFAGGLVDIGTKSFPDAFELTLSTSTAYNSQTTLQEGFLTHFGGDKAWLGMDDGVRALPGLFSNPDYQLPDIGSAFTDPVKAEELSFASKAFNPVMSPTSKDAPLNQGYSFSLAAPLELFGRPLGVISSLTYSRNFTGYSGGTAARYKLTGNVSQTNDLTNDFLLNDQRGTDEVVLGGLANFSFKPADNHELGINFMVNHVGESSSRYLLGSFPRDLSGRALYESRVLKFVERDLATYQFRGEHLLGGLQVDWKASIADSRQEEPDLRYFTNTLTPRLRNGVMDSLYSIQTSIYPAPTRYFRTLDENNFDGKIDFTLPFRQWSGLSARLKFGGSWIEKDRAFRERRFEVRQDAARYEGDPVDFFAPQNMGINPDRSTERFFRFSNYVIDATQLSSNYDGEQTIGAGYLMADLPFSTKLRFVGGVRMESTRIDVISQDSSLAVGALSEDDVLPSANMVYSINDAMNLRMAYGKTLARPTFRELAPYATFEYVNDYIFIGNPELQRTLVDNFDIRWETFARRGEIYAVSLFYKDFENPIERVINPIAANPEVQYRNVETGTVYGAEFELRKQLDTVADWLGNFQLGGNLSLIHSSVDIAADELEAKRAVDSAAEASRPLLGQSDYVVNANLTYDNLRSGTTVSLLYNIFGDRLSEVSTGGTPDVYEKARGVLDFVMSQSLWRNISLKFAVKNLFDSPVRKSHTFQGVSYDVQRYLTGRAFSFSISYRLN